MIKGRPEYRDGAHGDLIRDALLWNEIHQVGHEKTAAKVPERHVTDFINDARANLDTCCLNALSSSGLIT